jgi:hypothetical protein
MAFLCGQVLVLDRFFVVRYGDLTTPGWLLHHLDAVGHHGEAAHVVPHRALDPQNVTT